MTPEIFSIVLAFAIGIVAFVILQTTTIVFLIKWNNELRNEVELNKPPF